MKSVFTHYVPIEKLKYKRKSAKTVYDDNNPHYYPNSGIRSTAESGGLETVTALEFNNIEDISDKCGFEKMFEVLDIINGMDGIISVKYNIAELRRFRKWGKFIFLDDEVTQRKCLIAMISGATKCSILIDIQLESKSISTLLLVGSNLTKYNEIIDRIIKEAIHKSGSWPEELLEIIANTYNLKIYRYKHTSADVEAMAKRIGEKAV